MIIVHIQISIDSRPYNEDTSTLESTEVEIKPEFLPCLDIGKLPEKLAAAAVVEYLARQAEQEAAE